MKNNQSVKHWEFETIGNITLAHICAVGRAYQAKIFNQNHKKQITTTPRRNINKQ